MSLLSVLGVAACSDDRDDPNGTGGTAGGTSGAGGNGATGGSGGSGGDSGVAGNGGTDPGDGGLDAAAGTGGLPGDGGSPGTATFVAVVDGTRVVVTTSDEVWTDSCSRELQVVQWSNGAWVPLRDERPEGNNTHKASHYDEGTYRSDCRQNAGCDTYGCSLLEFRDEFTPLPAVEYVEVGQRAAPVCGEEDAGVGDAGSDAGVRIVPDIEQVVPTNPLGVRVTYYSEQGCNNATRFVQVVEIE